MTPRPRTLDALLRAVWRRAQVLRGSAGLLAFCRWALLVFLVGLAVDWLVDLPGAARAVVLGTLVAVASYAAWSRAWRHLHRYDAARTALRVEERHGGLESLLVTAVQLGENGPESGNSAALCAETCRLAEESAGSLRPEDAVSFAGLRRLLLLALVPVSIAGVLAVVNGPLLSTGLVRIFLPWSTIEYPTRTQIELVGGDRIVQEGDGLRLAARLSGEVPDSARIVLRTGQGEPRERALAVVDGACAYEAETVFRSFDYRVSAGDATTDWHTVRVVSSPRIERAEVHLEFPEYTGRPAETVESLTLTVPEGTRLRWTLALDRAVQTAELRPVEGTPLALEVGANGRSAVVAQVAAESRAYSFGWVDAEHGFAFTSPRYYLQVAPDRAPSVELTAPDGLLYATLGRPLDFAFRGRDDHGIGQALMAYRVGKTAEARVALPTPERSDGREQRIDWDYRAALPDLAIGDTVSFAVELVDRYPGPDGPHRARSDSRRVRFLSKEDYLAQIEKERRRLLARIRSIYREERAVHDLVRDLHPTADLFVQTCQLEAVRQDMIKDRLGAIQGRIDVLVEDLAANGVSAEAEGAALVDLGAELQRIGAEHVGRAATLLRELAAVDDGAGWAPDPAPAIDEVHRSARELGLVVLQLGFAEASDVMARELHATAQTQAALRLETVLGGDGGEAALAELAARQVRLAGETARLLEATPRNTESTERDALIAFNLSRLVNGLMRAGTDARMRAAATLVTEAEDAPSAALEAAEIQAEVIAALLRAEFRLRRGAEYEALTEAHRLLAAQVAEQRRLRGECAALEADAFHARRADLARAQSALQRRLQLLLLPEVPAPRPRLFDEVAPAPPPVDEHLARAEGALQAARACLEAGDRAALAAHQEAAERAFAALAELVRERMEDVTREERVKGVVAALGKQSAQRLMLEERLLVLLELIEDAADDDAPVAALAAINQALAEDARGLRERVALWNESLGTPLEDGRPLLESLARTADAVGHATPLLAGDEVDAALELLEQALEELEGTGALIEERTRTEAAFADVLATTGRALAPSPLLTEIVSEQVELSALTETAALEDRPNLIVPQKNLIHAVNAVLTSLDPLAHKIESGTVMLFAKEDMGAAAIGLETDDLEEALDAQAFVVESLEDLRAGIDAATPQYRYVREVTEFLHALAPLGDLLHAGARQLRAGATDASTAPKADALRVRAQEFVRATQRLTGAPRFADSAGRLAEALASPDSGRELDVVLAAFAADTTALRTLTENLAYLITPPPAASYVAEPTPEVRLIHAALAVAAHHTDLARETRAAGAEQLADLATRQRELARACAALFDGTAAPHPHLVAAADHLVEAATSLESADPDAAFTRQGQGADALRAFVLESTLAHVQVPPPPPPQDPAPSSDAVPEDGELQLFLPGALTGTRPKGGRLEWQVLGRRDRAALNENFARELPLEYRAILKDYYERLTR